MRALFQGPFSYSSTPSSFLPLFARGLFLIQAMLLHINAIIEMWKLSLKTNLLSLGKKQNVGGQKEMMSSEGKRTQLGPEWDGIRVAAP